MRPSFSCLPARLSRCCAGGIPSRTSIFALTASMASVLSTFSSSSLPAKPLTKICMLQMRSGGGRRRKAVGRTPAAGTAPVGVVSAEGGVVPFELPRDAASTPCRPILNRSKGQNPCRSLQGAIDSGQLFAALCAPHRAFSS